MTDMEPLKLRTLELSYENLEIRNLGVILNLSICVTSKSKIKNSLIFNASFCDNDISEEMAEAYRRCQARRGRASGALPGTAGYASQRRRSRAVLYHLSGQFEKHNRANRAKSKLQQLNKVL